MNKLQLIKIALLTALLVEEVRNAKGEKIHKYKFSKGYGNGQTEVSVTNFGLSERTAKLCPKCNRHTLKTANFCPFCRYEFN
ncbi:hypothetical protein [Staphylococcus pasteuri]|uniref:hypothetical protein n=1 Tax=Staphylococcus pasteuri TaxID=45972 RepID=UPI0012B87BA4|nr:hypothetical protein [Staphylococcus pasteuri]